MPKRRCENCGHWYLPKVKWQRFCCPRCKSAHKFKQRRVVKVRKCKWCGKSFKILQQSDNNRKFCSPAHFHEAYREYRREWHARNPEAKRKYHRQQATSGKYREKGWKERLSVIAFLGGRCVQCGHDNPRHLQVDHIPANHLKENGFRHPRHLKFIREHRDEFQLLCANHHQEKTWREKLGEVMPNAPSA